MTVYRTPTKGTSEILIFLQCPLPPCFSIFATKKTFQFISPLRAQRISHCHSFVSMSSNDYLGLFFLGNFEPIFRDVRKQLSRPTKWYLTPYELGDFRPVQHLALYAREAWLDCDTLKGGTVLQRYVEKDMKAFSIQLVLTESCFWCVEYSCLYTDLCFHGRNTGAEEHQHFAFQAHKDRQSQVSDRMIVECYQIDVVTCRIPGELAYVEEPEATKTKQLRGGTPKF